MVTEPTAHPAEPRALEAQLTAFEHFERQSAEVPRWLRALQTSGISYFAELGFPTTKHEEWRFTNVAPIAALPFKPVFERAPHSLPTTAAARFEFPNFTGHRLVFVDGHFAAELSTILPEARGVIVKSLAAALREDTALAERHLAHGARFEQQAFVALNTAFIQDGAFIHVPARAEVAAPVHLLFISATPGVTAQPRNLIVVEAEASARVIEEYVSLATSAAFTNAVTEIFAAENARLEHLKVQRESSEAFHVATIEASVARGAHVTSHSISFGGKIARNDINLRFHGQGAEGVLNGVFLGDGDQVVDHHTVADHAQPHCNSHEFYHGILAGRSKGVFNGKIFVRKDAQKTDAKQTNKNLVLSDDATINTKPQLEILADDVKCTHGATVGQLEEDALFYLRARGIGEAMARRMLIRAFAEDVLDRITIEPVRVELDRLLIERLDVLTEE